MIEAGPATLLCARGISKRFPGVQALDSVDLELGVGEVLAVVGENGAGKSTLMKILAGEQRADEGTILLDGEPFHVRSVSEAMSSGIALIHQELALAENLDVGSNVLLGREPSSFGFIRRRRADALAREALARVGLDVAPTTEVSGMGMGQRQLVEIAKALSSEARILIMDEPTSSLTLAETQTLFEVVDLLRARGTSVIYISHRLGEVERIADRVVVLRDGRNAGRLEKSEVTHDAMVRLMVGRDVSRVFDRTSAVQDEDALVLDGVRTMAHPAHQVSLRVRRGEIVGLAGLVGAGRTELLRAVFGIEPALDGTVKVGGRQCRTGTPGEAMQAGLALVPEDRKADGLLLEESVRTNTVLASLKRLARGIFTSRAREQDLARTMIDRLDVQPPGDTTVVGGLSGGNQQKVVLGRWLARDPEVLLLDEPTRGVDIGAKDEIYRLMDRSVRKGRAVLFASSEMEELISLADRICVMHEGRISGELLREEFDEEAIMQLATGGDLA
jgi:ribose transport system ATP-binding protein